MIGLLRQRKSPHGFAFLTVLTAILLVVVLLTALFRSQRSRSTLHRFNRDQEIAREATLSLLEYTRFSLEQDQTWLGAEPLQLEAPLRTDERPLFRVESLEREDSEPVGQSFIIRLEGVLLAEEEIPFSLTLENNLANESANLGLSAHRASVDVTARYGGAKVRKIWLLRHAAFANSTVAASGDISLDTESITFSTTDPSRNQIRSMGNVFLPVLESLNFEPGAQWQRAETGTVWAYDTIRVGPEDDPTPLEDASLETGAQFLPNGRSAYRVPKLEVDQVGADPNEESVLEVPPGRYQVGHAKLEFEDLSGETHDKSIAVFRLDDRSTGRTVLHFVEEHLQDEMPAIDMSTVRLASSPSARVVLSPSTSSRFIVGRGFTVDLPKAGRCHISLPARTKVICQGSLDIGGFSSGDLPLLEFRQTQGVSADGPERGYLECKSGNLSIACDLRNAGLLMSRGDVNLYPADVEVAASLSEDLAIFAGGDVNIDPRLVGNAIESVQSGGRKLAFRGLIYAAGSVNFDTASEHRGALGNTIFFNREVEVEGSIVARGGQVNIRGEYGAELRYNPDFLDDVMESALNSESRQLEVISDREF